MLENVERHPSAKIALALIGQHGACFMEAADSCEDRNLFWAATLFAIAGYIACDLGQEAVEKMYAEAARIVKDVPDIPVSRLN